MTLTRWTINDLFGGGATQSIDSLSIELADLGLPSGTIAADRIAAALVKKWARVSTRAIEAVAIVPITANGENITIPELTIDANGQPIIANGVSLLYQTADTIQARAIEPLTANGEPLTFTDFTDRPFEIRRGKPQYIYQRDRLERIDRFTLIDYIPYG